MTKFGKVCTQKVIFPSLPRILQGMAIDIYPQNDYNKDVFVCNGGVCPWKI